MPEVSKKAGIITFFGAKGGVGKSVIASNLAIDLIIETKKPVLLLDMNLSFGGDLAQILNVKDGLSITQILSKNLSLNAELIKSHFGKIPQGLYFLPANMDDFSSNEILKPERIQSIIEFCSNYFNYIVIDAGNFLSNEVISVLDESHLILITLQPDLLSLNQTQRTLSTLQKLQYSMNNIHLLLNCNGMNPAVTPTIISNLLKKEFLAVFSYEPALVANSVNKKEPFVLKDPNSTLTREIDNLMLKIIGQPGTKYGEGILPKLIQTFQKKKTDLSQTGAFSIQVPIRDEAERFKQASSVRLKIHQKLVEECSKMKINLDFEGDTDKKSQLVSQISMIISNIIDSEKMSFPSRQERQNFINEIVDEALGLGPLEILLRDPEVDEIMVTDPDTVYTERKGKIELTKYKFSSEKHLMGVIKRIMAPLGRRIDDSSPYQDARLKDGSRVHAIIPPLALRGPTLTIRKFKTKKLTSEELIKLGSTSKEIMEFLKICVQTRKNIIISGGTGSGKTTLLNILSSNIFPDERIVTIEDAAELQLPQEHVVRLEARPPNIEGKGEVTIRDLVRNSLRMRPDRIVVGECRGGEALDMLQAMNTGHDGSLTTIHANSPRDALKRIETLVLFAGLDLPVKAIREQIASAINIIVQISRFSDGSRKITNITEITGIQTETLTTQDIFIFKQTGIGPNGKILGRFEPTGLIPRFIDDLQRIGITLSREIFLKSST
ncbi:MAG: ATPase, T2SS/T4P/T4SS family [Acidobacteriota bacterium]